MPTPIAMDVFARPDLYSQAPPTARQEPDAPVFSGSPSQVAESLGPRMPQRTHTLAPTPPPPPPLAPVGAEPCPPDRAGWPTGSLTFALKDETSVTARP